MLYILRHPLSFKLFSNIPFFPPVPCLEEVNMKTLFRARRGFALLCLILASLSIGIPAFAQLDYDTYDIYQNGAIVGVIYVPLRGADTSVYNEYWIMSNRYVYPSVTSPVATEIVPTTGYHYTSLTDFLAKSPWGDGYHYVTVTAYDRTSKPVPATTVVE